MEIVYSSEILERQCTELSAAAKLFGGNKMIARKLLSRVNALKQAPTIKDIVVQRQFSFHSLDSRHRRKLKGFFAIDVAGSRCPWRIVLQPLDKNGEPFDLCNIDEIAEVVEVVGILEVSNHYE